MSRLASVSQPLDRRGGAHGAEKETCNAAMTNVGDSSTLGRVIAGFAMGSLTLALIGLSAALGLIGVAAVLHPLA